MTDCYLTDMGITCALGNGKKQVAENLFSGNRNGMITSDQYQPEGSMIVGQVSGELPVVPTELQQYNSRNSQLLLAALADMSESVDSAIDRYGASRIGVVIGTSTSGIAEGEAAHRHYHQSGQVPADYNYLQQAIGSPAEFLRSYLATSGPAYTISTACSSGARALLSARRLLALGVCDVVIAGGVDSLCGMTIQGFASLEAVSAGHCNPLSANRDGINIGEGAGLFLVTRELSEIALLGVGSSSDAYHISGPDPSGAGAVTAMQAALDDAGLDTQQVDYLNLHGTATQQNDSMESQAVAQLFGSHLLCSSSKPMTGHTLGAAGAIEATFCWMTVSGNSGALPPHLWDGVVDGALAELNLVAPSSHLDGGVSICMSNSFAFGGNNISLIIGRKNCQDGEGDDGEGHE